MKTAIDKNESEIDRMKREAIEWLDKDRNSSAPSFIRIAINALSKLREGPEEKPITINELESLKYIKKTEELISMGDIINIKARLIHLKRIIEEDFSHPVQSVQSVKGERTAREIVDESFTGLDSLIDDKDILQFYKDLIVTCMEEYRTQSDKDMYPKQFILWIGEQELFYDKEEKTWIVEVDNEGLVYRKSMEELFEYWSSNHK